MELYGDIESSGYDILYTEIPTTNVELKEVNKHVRQQSQARGHLELRKNDQIYQHITAVYCHI